MTGQFIRHHDAVEVTSSRLPNHVRTYASAVAVSRHCTGNSIGNQEQVSLKAVSIEC